MAKAVLVAGGAGFIGSHLCDYLLARGERVICTDSLITGSRDNILHILQNKDYKKNFRFIKADISKKISLGAVSQIYNLASPASPVDYQDKPLETLQAGSLGNKNLLEIERAGARTCSLRLLKSTATLLNTRRRKHTGAM